MRRNAALIATLASLFATAQAPTPTRLLRIGGIAGESGIFASSDDQVTMYSNGDIYTWSGAGSKRQLIVVSGSISLMVKGETLQRSQTKIPLALAHDFQLCDAFDQIDISRSIDKGISSILPKYAKIKSAETLGNGLTFVVYATADSTATYPIRAAMIEGDAIHGYAIVGIDSVSSDGNYCGVQTIGRNYRAILVNEPAGSSDASAVYLYLLKR
jgi:hypothetical protein